MLNRLLVQNFKSIGETGVDLEMKPLTVLVGPNGAGKSATWEALALLCQSVPGDLQISGRFVQFPTPLEFVHRQEENAWVGIELEIGPAKIGYRLEYQAATGESRQRVSSRGRTVLSVKVVGDRRQGYRTYLVTPDEKEFDGGYAPPTFPVDLFIKGRWPGYEDAAAITEAQQIWEEVRSFLAGAVFLAGERGRVPSAEAAGPQVNDVGFRGEHVLSLLALIFGARRYSPIKDQITRYAQRFGLLGLNAGARPGNQVGADYLDPVLKIPVNLSLASFGARQLVPIITQLFWSRPDTTVFIEEPEISLHPESQLRLLELFGAAIKDGKQVVVTTHS